MARVARFRVRDELLDRVVAPPLHGSAIALCPVAPLAGGHQVGGGGRTTANPGIYVVDLEGLLPAIAACPTVPVQDGASEERMDPALPRLAGRWIPIQER
jgi:hypothetical protein